MDVTLRLTKEQLLFLQGEMERLAHSAYMDENIQDGKFYEEIVRQLERERWKK